MEEKGEKRRKKKSKYKNPLESTRFYSAANASTIATHIDAAVFARRTAIFASNESASSASCLQWC